MNIRKTIMSLDQIKAVTDVQLGYKRLTALSTGNFYIACALAATLTCQHIDFADSAKSSASGDLLVGLANHKVSWVQSAKDKLAYLNAHPSLQCVHNDNLFKPLTKKDLFKTINSTERTISGGPTSIKKMMYKPLKLSTSFVREMVK